MKEVMKDVVDFDTAIEALDSLLEKGLKLTSAAAMDITIKSSDDEGHDKWIDSQVDLYAQWTILTREEIIKRTDRSYYLMHFNSPAYPARLDPTVNGSEKRQQIVVLNMQAQLKALEEVLLMLEERRNVTVRQAIAQREHDNSWRYWLKYDAIQGKLYMNENILLASTRLESPADKLLQQAFASPNKLIELKDVTPTQVSSALRDLYITSTIKKIFFPRTSGIKIMFRPFITNTEFVDEKHKEISFNDMRNSEK